MKTILFDSLGEAEARKLDGCKVVDESGESIGTVDGLWMDSTSRHVEFVGVKSNSLSGKVHLVPAAEAQIVEEGYLTKLRCRTELMANAPSFLPGAGRSEKSADRQDLEKSDQAFFNQSGFITDSLPEVDASQELLRVQNEAKARNREDRIKSRSLD
jgi:sporulation protein YlmC with PRC-barrel domain